MDNIEKARLHVVLVAIGSGILIGFTATKFAEDDIAGVVLFAVVVIGVLLSLPALLWESKWRREITEWAALLSVVLVIPSTVVFGPIFVVPLALLCVSAAALLREKRRQ
jgi:hypothetical protein